MLALANIYLKNEVCIQCKFTNVKIQGTILKNPGPLTKPLLILLANFA